MFKIILQDDRYIHPFNERARDLRVHNKPLWLLQRDALAGYTDREMELPPEFPMPESDQPTLVYRDNLFFDEGYITKFITQAKTRPGPCRAAFRPTDPAFREHALPLATSFTPGGGLYWADLWYYPTGPQDSARPEPLIVDLQASEAGYYHIPTYMASDQGDLTFQVPRRGLLAIDSWVHIFIADIVFGLFGHAARWSDRLDTDPLLKLKIVSKAMLEGTQVLNSSELVQVGRNCTISPFATIGGPTMIGDNVTIEAGAVIDNCIIGDNVTISQGCQLMLSVVGDGAFLPFRAALYMTTLMENCMVAQNTCLQMCVVGRNTFIGAGSTFTDFNLLPTPIRALDGGGDLTDANRPVLGGCVGHNCRLGAGMIVYPARTIESDVVLVATTDQRVIYKDISFEESDHHHLPIGDLHHRLYPRRGEAESETW